MEVNRISDYDYEIIHDGKKEVGDINYVLWLLSRPAASNKVESATPYLDYKDQYIRNGGKL